MTAPRQTFRKHERLCRRKLIERLLAEGRVVHEPPFRLTGSIVPLDAPVPAQVAFAVPKRNLPKATDRNRVKRLMREAYRRHKHTHYEQLRTTGRQCALLFVYQGREVPSYTLVSSKICRALERWFQQHG